MAEPIIYVDRSAVRDGRLNEFQAGMEALVNFVEANKPQILSYDVYFSDDGSRMTVIHVHADPESLEYHMEVAGPEFPTVAEYIDLETIDVYGRPGEELVAQLREKASTLGDGTVTVHDRYRGFDRFPDE